MQLNGFPGSPPSINSVPPHASEKDKFVYDRMADRTITGRTVSGTLLFGAKIRPTVHVAVRPGLRTIRWDEVRAVGVPT